VTPGRRALLSGGILKAKGKEVPWNLFTTFLFHPAQVRSQMDMSCDFQFIHSPFRLKSFPVYEKHIESREEIIYQVKPVTFQRSWLT